MDYKVEFQSNNTDLQTILNIIENWKSVSSENPPIFIPTESDDDNYKSKAKNNNIDLKRILDMIMLVDFEYVENEDGALMITDWKGTFNGFDSTEVIIPDYNGIIL